MKERSLRFNIFFLQSLAEHGRLKEFAVFLHLKSLYSNSCILDYTQQTLAEKSGLPLSAVKKYVNLFISQGWCKRHFSSLVFEKISVIDQGKKKFIFKFSIGTSVKQIFDDLCHQVLKIKQRQFDRYQKLRADLNNPHPTIKRRANRLADKLNLKDQDIGASSMLKISIKTIAKIIGVSVGSAAALIKRLRVQGIINCVTGFHSIVAGAGRYAKGLMNAGGTFYHNGKVHIIACNQYQF